MKKYAILLLLCVMLPCILSGCKEKTEPAAGVPNPMVQTDEAGLMEKLGLRFGTVKGAENIQYFVIADTLGEMRFSLDGTDLCARIQPAAEYTDISGMYYNFEEEEDIMVGSCAGKRLLHNTNGEMVEVCLWFDAAPGIMYSLSAQGDDLSSVDFLDIAQQVYTPMQGEAP